ncbi:MAG: 1-deoxy-D-xylulose-5-phosphate reductoisomerase [Deltaproteobacteria bacterium]|jgi:1-deoxy-D-xylulose-5-phosphate reductoisomerase|nr:1-deoxy-D-xylulose-5-phosphate reductoisomerase [Deltaproteobacteria bacterium]
MAEKQQILFSGSDKLSFLDSTGSIDRAGQGGPVKLSVLGSTGSIGRATLSLAQAFPEYIAVAALAARSSVTALDRQIRLFKPSLVAVGDDNNRQKLCELLSDFPDRPEIMIGEEGLYSAAAQSGADTVLSALVGAAGLKPTWSALKEGLKVCLANKESLVLGGELLMKLAGHRLAPVDSEHSAIFQALGGKLSHPDLDRLILTASGGPFRGYTLEALKKVTKEEALKHPTWSMGPKITCDSATMMNKGLEVIEAHHLFGLDYSRIEVLVHPKSYIHSLVGFKDGSILAQMGPTDMRLAIAYALSHPRRWPLLEKAETVADFKNFRDRTIPEKLFFEEPDRKVFKALALAEAAGRAGGTAPAVLNAANEVAVEAFLAGRISFTDIADLVERTLSAIPTERLTDLTEALAADAKARQTASNFLER